MVIQAMDLALVAPLAILSGILLLRCSAWGYLLASVSLLKGLTMATAVSAKGINMVLAGVPVSAVELGIFPTLTLCNFGMVFILLKNIETREDQFLTEKSPAN